MSVRSVAGRRRDGFVNRDGVECRIGAAGDVYVVNGVAANQLLRCVAQYVSG